MIDYLEDLLEEEAAVELTGRHLVPVGRKKDPSWEEDEPSLWAGQVREKASVGDVVPAREERGRVAESGRPSWAEAGLYSDSGAVRLLGMLNRAVQAVGMVRGPGKTLTVTLPRENTRAGSLDLETIDRAVQRDARRYDGGFPLY